MEIDVQKRITAVLTDAYQKALDQINAGADLGTAWDTVYQRRRIVFTSGEQRQIFHVMQRCTLLRNSVRRCKALDNKVCHCLLITNHQTLIHLAFFSCFSDKNTI